MYYLLTLFFASLLGITLMIGRKLVLLESGRLSYERKDVPRVPYAEEIKRQAVKSAKKHAYRGLVGAIRLYVRASHFLKNTYEEMKTSIRTMRRKDEGGEASEKKEASGFLKRVSEYKRKIRRIKQKVKEEENL